MSHSAVPPSGLHITVPCPRSLTLQASVPPTPDTNEILEGEVAHVVAHHTAARVRQYKLGDVVDWKGKPWKVDNDMLEGAAIYANETQISGRFEDPVAIPEVHDACYGTPDFWEYRPALNAVDDVDFKHGHRYVEEFENYQGASYLAGVGNKLQLPDTVATSFTVVQPRCYTAPAVRVWHSTLGKIRQLIGDVIRPAVAKALGPDPEAKPGRHCLDCSARHICSALQRDTSGIVDFVARAEPVTQNLLAMGTEARILHDALARLKARYEGLTANIEAIAKGGGNVPYWHMAPGQSKLAWDVPVADVIAMGRTVNLDLTKPQEVITPTQAKAAGLDETFVLAFASRGKSALKLKPDDALTVRKVFNQ